MSTLSEIEAATEGRTAQEKEAWYRFLAERLCSPGPGAGQSDEGNRFNAAAHRAWLQTAWGGRRFTDE